MTNTYSIVTVYHFVNKKIFQCLIDGSYLKAYQMRNLLYKHVFHDSLEDMISTIVEVKIDTVVWHIGSRRDCYKFQKATNDNTFLIHMFKKQYSGKKGHIRIDYFNYDEINKDKVMEEILLIEDICEYSYFINNVNNNRDVTVIDESGAEQKVEFVVIPDSVGGYLSPIYEPVVDISPADELVKRTHKDKQAKTSNANDPNKTDVVNKASTRARIRQ